MAKYKAYPEYKDSEHNFVRTIPKHWGKSTVGAISSVIDPQPDHRAPVICDDGSGYPYIGIRDVNKDGTLNFETARPVEESAVIKQEKNFIIRPHDIVFCKVGTLGLPRKIIPNGRCALSATLVLIKADETIDSQFLLYTLDSDIVVSQTNYLATGSTRAALGIQQIRKFQIPIPSSIEQQQIAVFLDYETAKIDDLIEKQQQLIELLKEKRQAVISHAVTKGLNPDAPMKDSDVEWLGNIPEHWVVSSLKYMAKVIDCKHITAEFSDVGIPVASISEVKSWFVDLSSAKLTNEKDYLSLIDGGRKPVCGDILYSRNATVGEAAIVSENMPDFAMGQDVCLIKTNEKVIPEFILYTLKSDVIAQQLNLAMVGSTFKRINVDDIRNFSIAIPSKNEQVLIVKMLMGKLEKYDRIISNAVDVITYMQERRTALISAAVTGKIDVRDWVAPDTQVIEEPQEASA